MFHSETLARAIHADRVRDLERAARDHLLLVAPDPVAEPVRSESLRQVAETRRPAARGGSAGATA